MKTRIVLTRDCSQGRAYWRFLLLLLSAIPLAAYPLTLSDYLNKSTVTASSGQFETDLTNNVDEIQIIPNAELVVVKQIVNDDGGDLVPGDFNLSTSAGTLTFGAGTTSGATTTYTSQTIYVSPGTYTLIEDDVGGYTEGSWSCTAGIVGNTAFNSGEVSLAFGEQTVCTIINDDIAPTLTLAKTLVNNDGGDLTIADFDISIDGTEVTSGAVNTVAANTVISIAELDVDGYTEGAWSCIDNNGLTAAADLPSSGTATGASMTLEPGSAVVCEITNDDIAPTLTLTKTLINDNGGNLTIADFDISIDGTEVVSAAVNTVAANTGITIAELDVSGYTEGTWSCSDSTGLTAAANLPSAGAATGASMTLEPGSVVTCDITNNDIAPTIALTKTVINDNCGDLTIGDFDISIDGTEVSSGAVNPVMSNTTITIAELDLDGYTEGTWSCTDSTGLTAAADLPAAGLATGTAITLAPGSIVACQITNDDQAPTLTLSKTLINDDGGDLTVADFDIAIDGTEVVNNAVTAVKSNTPITISELDVDGYLEGSWSCSDSTGLTAAANLPSAGAATGASMTLEPGSDVTCEITNNDIAPTLTLTKNLLNDDGGDLTIADFDLSINSTVVASGVANNVLANTALTISEPDLGGYTEGTWSCSDSTGLTAAADLPGAGVATGTIVTLEPGSVVTCEITNDDIAPTLTLTKNLINDNGGDLAIGDFDIAVDGTEVPSGFANTVVANTAISISELDVAGYSEGTWSCNDSAGLTAAADLPSAGPATGTSLTLEAGSTVTCEITNDDIAPTLTLTKTLVNDNGGDLSVADFDISIGATEVVSGAPNTVSANTAITISELDVGGYTEGTWACSDSTGLTAAADLPDAGAATGSTLTLKPGSQVTCEITNDDIAPQLTLSKTVINDNGGSLSVDDFDIAIDGIEVTSGAATTVSANTPVTISELDLLTYAEGSWACTDANGLTPAADLPVSGLATGTSLTLEPGSDVTCSITNNDLGIDLSIVKAVDDQTPNIGQTITFTLTVVNAGPDVATNASVTDVVPAGFTYVAGTISGGSTSDDTDPAGAGLSWTLANMPAGVPFILNFDAVVNAP